MDDNKCPLCGGSGRVIRNHNTTTHKTARTIKEYTTDKFMDRYTITVPVGSVVWNTTAMGPDDNYRFWSDYHGKVEPIHHHDLEYYGLDIPAEYCEPYDE